MIALHVGLSGEKQIEVTLAVSATHMGSGSMGVFATPAMVGLIERAAMELVQPALAENETTVGVEVHVRHLAATPVGMHVRARVELVAVEGRFLTFQAEVFDDKEKVGEGTHKRAIIRRDRFMARMQEKST
jgi:fluoroacetyl-CoA thioesterase